MCVFTVASEKVHPRVDVPIAVHCAVNYCQILSTHPCQTKFIDKIELFFNFVNNAVAFPCPPLATQRPRLPPWTATGRGLFVLPLQPKTTAKQTKLSCCQQGSEPLSKLTN